MPNLITKLIPNGTLYTTGYFDEVTYSSNKITTDAVYSAELDEVNLSSSITKRETNDGKLLVSNNFDEQSYSGIVASYNFNNSFDSIVGNIPYNLVTGDLCSFEYVTGLNGQAIKFLNFGTCGQSSGLYCATSPWDLYNNTTDASFSIWIYLFQNITQEGSCGYSIFGNAFGNFGFNVEFTTTQNVLRYNLAGTLGFNDTSALSLSSWNHIVGTWKADTKTFTIYKNSNLIIQQSNITLVAPFENFAGFGINGSGGYSAGEYGVPITFDTVNLYNRTLTQEDVTFFYNNGNGREV